MTLMKAYRMHLKENVALLQTKGLVFIIYSMVVCAYLIPSTEVTNHAKEMNLSWCLARVFSQHSSDCKWQTQNSKWLKEKWNYMDAEESHEKNGTIKLWKRQEFRWASGTVKPRIQYIVILFPFPIAFVYLFFSLTPNGLWLPIQKKKKKGLWQLLEFSTYDVSPLRDTELIPSMLVQTSSWMNSMSQLGSGAHSSANQLIPVQRSVLWLAHSGS